MSISKTEALERIREAVSIAGTQTAFAEANGISKVYVGDVLRGARSPGEKILAAVGLTKIEVYVETAKAA